MTRVGATYVGDDRTEFLVWASRCDAVELLLDDGRAQKMEPRPRGYFHAAVDGVRPGDRYRYRLHRDGDGLERPDPASRWQPDGVHGASAVVDPDHPWSDDAWHGIPTRDLVIYELHVGTFTEGGTFDSAIERLADLVDLGITAVELMPVAQFPGARNWGYDGVQPFAAQSTYGGPDGFRRFVDAAHAAGLAVILDVVYNHFGPEGAYHADFADYLTGTYDTPWGQAMNFDSGGSDEVRRYFIENALWWVDDCHVDGLRLDAVHAIFDRSARHFLHELADAVHDVAERRNRRIQVIAESDLNDPRLVRAPEVGGYGLDGAWSDDFHHSVHALFTGEDEGYYRDFGRAQDVAAAIRDGYVFAGRYSAYRGHSHGAPPHLVPGERFVVCAQNHDQVGNRMEGDRLTASLDDDALKVVAATVLLSPYLPLLFMGEEYGETAPFQYFVSHTDEDLVSAVRRGRREEFSGFDWSGEPPDPQSEETFRRSRLEWSLRDADGHRDLLAWYRELLRLRREVPALAHLSREHLEVVSDDRSRCVAWHRWHGGSHVIVAVNASGDGADLRMEVPEGAWRIAADSRGDAPSEIESDGAVTLALSPRSAVVYARDRTTG